MTRVEAAFTVWLFATLAWFGLVVLTFPLPPLPDDQIYQSIRGDFVLISGTTVTPLMQEWYDVLSTPGELHLLVRTELADNELSALLNDFYAEIGRPRVEEILRTRGGAFLKTTIPIGLLPPIAIGAMIVRYNNLRGRRQVSTSEKSSARAPLPHAF